MSSSLLNSNSFIYLKKKITLGNRKCLCFETKNLAPNFLAFKIFLFLKMIFSSLTRNAWELTSFWLVI